MTEEEIGNLPETIETFLAMEDIRMKEYYKNYYGKILIKGNFFVNGEADSRILIVEEDEGFKVVFSVIKAEQDEYGNFKSKIEDTHYNLIWDNNSMCGYRMINEEVRIR